MNRIVYAALEKRIVVLWSAGYIATLIGLLGTISVSDQVVRRLVAYESPRRSPRFSPKRFFGSPVQHRAALAAVLFCSSTWSSTAGAKRIKHDIAPPQMKLEHLLTAQAE